MNTKSIVIYGALLAVAAVGIKTFAGSAPVHTEKCIAVSTLARTTLDARRQGVTLDQVSDMLRSKQVYSGPEVWAVKQAYKAPADMDIWTFEGAILKECDKRGET